MRDTPGKYNLQFTQAMQTTYNTNRHQQARSVYCVN